MSNKVLLYIPQHLVKEQYPYSVLLYPFWGVQEKVNAPITTAIFKQYNFDPSYYSIVDDPALAEYIFLPYRYWFLLKEDPELITAYINEAKKINRPLLIDAIGDIMKDITIHNSVVLRYAHYKSKLKDNDVIIPVYTEDLLASYENGEITIRNKKNIPSVGFVGWSSLPFAAYPKTWLKDFPLFLLGFFTSRFDLYRKGVLFRRKVLKILERSPRIDTHFIYRESYSGNIKTAKGDADTLRKEFVENILESDYALCVRGDANQSTRFFEVLSLGRIPVFVDTDIALPLEDKINYKEFCIFVDYRDVHKIDKVINEFHKSISPEEFENMQRKARKAFEEYLRIDSYTKYLMQILKEKSKHETRT